MKTAKADSSAALRNDKLKAEDGAEVGAGEDVAVEEDGVGRVLRRGDWGDEQDCAEYEGFHGWSVAGSVGACMASSPSWPLCAKSSKHKG